MTSNCYKHEKLLVVMALQQISKHFASELSDILAAVFNELLEKGELTDSQQIAIIILLFIRGTTTDVGNYRLISLTNSDYKILAYILTKRIEPFLPDKIHTNQTAYMKNHFIGTNIRSMQDVIMQKDCIVLFLIFAKLLTVLVICF